MQTNICQFILLQGSMPAQTTKTSKHKTDFIFYDDTGWNDLSF